MSNLCKRLSFSHRRALRAAVAYASGQAETVLLVHPLLAHYSPSRLVTQPHSPPGLRWEAIGLPPLTCWVWANELLE
jgi:hypothetical protein